MYFLYKTPGASKLSFFDYVKVVSFISLSNYCISRLKSLFFHCVHYNFDFFSIQGAENKGSL